jgi:hypothetical protein
VIAKITKTKRPSVAALFNKMGAFEVLRVNWLTDYATVVMTVLAPASATPVARTRC